MLGFVPQPNLQKSGLDKDLSERGETQQIGWASFRATTKYSEKTGVKNPNPESPALISPQRGGVLP